MECPICASDASYYVQHPEAELYRCQACRHCFSVIVPQHIERYSPDYFEQTHRNWFRNPNHALFAQIVSLIRTDPTICSVIDVGCGKGAFLHYMIEQIERTVFLTGIDLSSNPPQPGIEFVTGDVITTPLHRFYDVVVSLAVIEHIADVHAFVGRLHDLCRPGGRIVVMTLNEASVLYGMARVLHRFGFAMPFNRLYSGHHLHHFTRRSLTILLQSHGLEIETAIMHNAPLGAIDIPVASPVLSLLLRMSVGVMFGIGRLTSMTYLQTLVCRRSRD